MAERAARPRVDVDRALVLPDDLFRGVTSKSRRFSPLQMSVFPLGSALGDRITSARTRRSVAGRCNSRPVRPARTPGPFSGPRRYRQRRSTRNDDLVHRRVSTARSPRPLLKTRTCPSPGSRGESSGLPCGGRAVGPGPCRPHKPRVAPAVEQITALAALAAGVAGGLGRRRAVVNDPDLAERCDGQHDLIPLGVIGHRVDVHPVGLGKRCRLRRGAEVADALQVFSGAFSWLARGLGLRGTSAMSVSPKLMSISSG